MAPKLSAALEISAYLTLTLVASVLAVFGLLSIEACTWLATAILVSLLFWAWRRFEGGRHPCFLFLGTLLLFQGGRLLAHVTGVMKDPMQIDVGTPVPIHVPVVPAEITLLILVLSAILVYAPCRLTYTPLIYDGGSGTNWLPALYALIVLTFPFALYKNVVYLAYIRAHGGYLAAYLDNAAVLASAGTLVRTISLIGTTALLLAYVLERRPKRLAFLVALYLALSIFNLLIGFRGEFFSQCLGLWFVHKVKTGGRFNIVPLLVASAIVAVVSVFSAAFRQEQTVATLSPIVFLAVQGVSLNVTEAAVMFSNIFSRYGFSYVFWGFFYDIVRAPDKAHILWTSDLSMFLNPIHAEMGYGTASSYLAELYLLGGIVAVIAGSLIIGFCFSALHRISARSWGAVVLVFLLPPMIYLPRVELLYPLAILVKTCISLLPICVFVFLYKSSEPLIRTFLHHQKRYLALSDSDAAPRDLPRGSV